MTHHILPLQYEEIEGKFIIEFKESIFSLIQSIFFHAESFIDQIELPTLVGIDFKEVIKFRNENLLEDTLELRLSGKEIHVFMSIIDAQIYTTGKLDLLLSPEEVNLKNEVLLELRQLNNAVRFW